MNVFLSIIILYYKVEIVLECCAESILRQMFKDFELLVEEGGIQPSWRLVLFFR